jgi:hypothetical protein
MVVSRVVVLVLADVKVEVEDAGPELTVMVPVPDRMDAEDTDAEDETDNTKWPRQAGTSDHGFTESTHLISGAILHETPVRPPDTRYWILDPPARPKPTHPPDARYWNFDPPAPALTNQQEDLLIR